MTLDALNQPALFDDERLPDRAHARRSDPETSHAAAASISPAELRSSQAAVLRIFSGSAAALKLTDDEIAAVYRIHVDRWDAPPQSPSGLRTRRRELVDLGYLRDSGDRHRLPSGRQSIAWERTNRQEAS